MPGVDEIDATALKITCVPSSQNAIICANDGRNFCIEWGNRTTFSLALRKDGAEKPGGCTVKWQYAVAHVYPQELLDCIEEGMTPLSVCHQCNTLEKLCFSNNRCKYLLNTLYLQPFHHLFIGLRAHDL